MISVRCQRFVGGRTGKGEIISEIPPPPTAKMWLACGADEPMLRQIVFLGGISAFPKLAKTTSAIFFGGGRVDKAETPLLHFWPPEMASPDYLSLYSEVPPSADEAGSDTERLSLRVLPNPVLVKAFYIFTNRDLSS